MQPRDIGIDVTPPRWDESKGPYTDDNCPFYGSLRVRGQTLTGRVSSSKMNRSAVIVREYTRYVPKYERFEKRTSRYTVHVPQVFGDLKAGQEVTIMECRPISKTKTFVVVDVREGKPDIMGVDYTQEGETPTPPANEAGEPPAEGDEE